MNVRQLIKTIQSIRSENSITRDLFSELIWPLRQFVICNKSLIETIAECPPGCSRQYLLNGLEDNFRLVLVIWGARATSPIHDHGNTAGIVLPVFGSIKEAKYQILGQEKGRARLRKTEVCHLKAGELTTINDGSQLHLMINEFPALAASVHLYLPAVNEYNLFHPDDADRFHIERQEQSFAVENEWQMLEEAAEKFALI